MAPVPRKNASKATARPVAHRRRGGLLSAATSNRPAATPAIPLPKPIRKRGRPPKDQNPDDFEVSTSRRYIKTQPPKFPELPLKPFSVAEINPKADFTTIELLQSGNYADAIVMTGDLQWKVHRTTLVARSVWFSDAFKKEQGVVMPEINLSPRPDHKVSLLLQCLYAHRLPDEFYDLASAEATFEKYVELFKLGDEFGVEFVRDDALTMLGRLCDQKLVAICSFNKEWSGREGVVNPRAGASVDFVDLGVALHDAFEGGIRTDLRAQSLLANFVYAGRAVLLEHPHLLNLVDSIDSIAAGLWRASNGQNLAGWLPNVKVKTFLGFDHTKKTQHPDRCELCDELFDDANRKRVMYDPHKVITRPAGYCGVCVEKHDGDAAPIFRRPGRTDLNYVDQMPVVKTEEDA